MQTRLSISLLAILSVAGCQQVQKQPESNDTVLNVRAANLDPPGMVMISAGEYEVGSVSGAKGHSLHRKVHVNAYWIDAQEVMVRQFAEFVRETKYKTVAERRSAEGKGYKGSLVWRIDPNTKRAEWTTIPIASWRDPEGAPGSADLQGIDPVQHIAYEDAVAYARWVRKEMPTEDEWEVAAWAGNEGTTYPWGNTLQVGKAYMANTMQGDGTGDPATGDKFRLVSPARSYRENNFGVWDMIGNVWELTQTEGEIDPKTGEKTHIAKGGCYLSPDSDPAGYSPSARLVVDESTTACHIGFRLVKHINDTTPVRRRKPGAR